jgi:hypothetical protein
MLQNDLHMMPFDPSEIVELKNTGEDPPIRKSNISKAYLLSIGNQKNLG